VAPGKIGACWKGERRNCKAVVALVSKVVALVSGGIDSPVALYSVLSSGADAVALHLDNRPFTNDQEVAKVFDLVRRVGEVVGREVPLYLAPHGMVSQVEIGKKCDPYYRCILCRRMMFRAAEILAGRVGADGICTGESVGQVASQTMHNMAVEENATELPIIRPLMGLDKTEIVSIAREIGTYDISTRPGLCCTLAPRAPVIRGRMREVLGEEKKLDIPGMLEKIGEGFERVEL